MVLVAPPELFTANGRRRPASCSGTGIGMTFTGAFFARDLELSPDALLVCRPG